MQSTEIAASGPEKDPLASGLSLKEYMQILRRRRAIVLQAFFLIGTVAIILTLMTRPIYRAAAQLLVEPASMNFNTVDSSNPLSAILALSQPQTVATQVKMLQAPSLQGKVLKTTGPASFTIKALDQTNVIEASAESTSPQVAADAANLLLNTYLKDDVNYNLEEVKNAQAFAQKAELAARKKLDASEADFKDFQMKNKVAEPSKSRDDQIARVNTLSADYEKAQQDLVALQAQIDVNKATLAAMPKSIATKTEATNTRIGSVEDQIAELKVQRDGLTHPNGGFTPKAGAVKEVDAKIATLQSRLKTLPEFSTAETITPNGQREPLASKIADLESQAAFLKTRMGATQQLLAQAKGQIGKYAQWQIVVARLSREHDRALDLEKQYAEKVNDLTLRAQAHHDSARILEMASVPGAPVRPNKKLNILLGLLAGLFVGVCLALLQDYLDDRINSVEDADRVLALPSLGYVPNLNAGDARLLPQMKTFAPVAESYRLLRTNIQFAAIDTPLKTMMVTSAGPGEGKTTTAINLAFAMVMDGKKVVLVDTDLRRPSVHKVLELPSVPGLTDVLLGKETLDNTLLEHSTLPGLSVLTSGSTPPNPAELLNSRAFRTLVDHLTEAVDLVIFDSPPVLVAADAPILASQMDGVVMVIEPGSTKRSAARQSVALLNKSRANLLGVMYNKMREIHSDGSYYQYGYQYHYAPTALTEEDKAVEASRALPSVSEKQ